MTEGTDITNHLPLTEVTFLILLSLASKVRHGYAIMKDVRRLSQGRIVLSTGTLYGAIKRLLAQGWIVRVSDTEQAPVQVMHPGRPRKAYALSDLGRRVLSAEIERLQALIAVARLRTVEERT